MGRIKRADFAGDEIDAVGKAQQNGVDKKSGFCENPSVVDSASQNLGDKMQNLARSA